MIKLLIGGSPCTFWSIAQKNNRETEPSGVGWELFKNYLIAKERFKPDFFLYENNKSAAQAIKNQISRELDVDLMYINSALVSAQNRQRFYAFNWKVDQPADRGILLKDILESGIADKEKAYCLTNRCGNTRDYFKKRHAQIVFEPIRLGDVGSNAQAHRVYSPYGKSVTLKANSGGQGGKTGLYFTPIPEELKNHVCDKGKIYQVQDAKISTKFGIFDIALPDGFYLIRKLTVKECCRLQTMPDDYCRTVSAQQGYKGLGNGWTAEVIIHILNGTLKEIPKDEEIVVLSMYDGIGTGRYCLDKMGFKNVKYYAYEIDKYAKQIAMSNYPDIIQMGDAFAIREGNWCLPI